MPTLVEFGHDISGTTTTRPKNADLGIRYFDTTLGVQLVYNGTGWQVVGGMTGLPLNMLDGGDFQTNPWQRGSSLTAQSSINTTPKYGPDRWFSYGGASSSVYFTKTANTDIAGFTQALQWGRDSGNSDTAAITLGQIIEGIDCVRAQSQIVTLSFWAKKAANYSGGALTVAIKTGTTADEGGTTLISGWTGVATPLNTTQTLTTTMTRYSFTTAAALAAGVNEIAVLLSYTPTGAGAANDGILFHGFMLEVGSAPSPFEFQDAEIVLGVCQRYFFRINEPAAGVVVGVGMVTTTNNEVVMLPCPTTMRVAPTVTVAVGQFKLNIAGVATTAAGFAAGTTHVPTMITVVSTTTATAGQATLLQGNGSTGTISASADL